MNNLEKYKKYELEIDTITTDFCLSCFPNGTPKKIYDISINHSKYEYGYYIREANVTDIGYRLTNENRKPWFDKRPSNENVKEIKKLSKTLKKNNLSSSDVMIYVKNGRTSWAKSFDCFAEGIISTDKNKLDDLLQKNIDDYINNYLAKDGQFNCAYCSKAVDNDKKITRTVIAAQYKNLRQPFDYCSISCASNHQMSHEG